MQLLAKILLKELFNSWGEWDKYRNYYLNELFPTLIVDPSKGTRKERELIVRIKEITQPNELENFDEIIKGNYSIYGITNEIESLISDGFFEEADKLFDQIRYLPVNKLLPHEYEKIKEGFRQKTISQINTFLKLYKFREAENLYLKYDKILNHYDFYSVKNEHIKKKEKEDVLNRLDYLLKSGDFLSADDCILNLNDSDAFERYEKEKCAVLRTHLRELEKSLRNSNKKNASYYIDGYFDDEKIQALTKTGKDILVEARAGSGKTTAIALRVWQLLKFYRAKPEEILVLAFNKEAAEGFRGRIEEYCGDGIATETNTLTFHALAKRIANTEKKLLDEGPQINFVQECFNAVEDRDRSLIGKLFHLFLRSASEKIRGAFRNDSEYYLYLRNQEYTTIAGEFVKSAGEKYIADFLFEHKISKNNKEIEYVYERNIKKFLDTKYSYNPDFSLFYADDKQKEQLQAVIEYFGFTKNNPGYPGFFEKEEESQKYLKESDEKRKLFSDKDVNFIEMSQDDFDNIKKNPSLDDDQVRDQFEKIIRQRLSKKGFSISTRLSEKEILQKIPNVERRKEKLVKQITQFINKAQKISYNPDKIRKISEAEKNAGNLSKRNEWFIKIACRVYDEYRAQLVEENRTDFDGLFVDAINKIKEEGSNCKIVFHGEKKIEGIKYILIDEYQDFSELFYRLIDEIRKANPTISFFCVGDDWQAINGFAGSDLKYFEMFETEYFSGGHKVSLLTNYRSDKNIVLHSNILMSGLGAGGEPRPSSPDGSVYLDELFRVEIRNDDKHKDDFEKDKKYLDAANLLRAEQKTKKSIPLELARYLKTVEYITSKKVNTKKQVCLLFRANELHGVPIEEFTNQIRKWRFPNEWDIEKKNGKPTGYINGITYSTVHSFKGKESDAVIIVGANRRSFPKFHPDNELMEILGVTMQKVRDEERRLFYVAITRAKEELFLIYNEKIGKSDFISDTDFRYRAVCQEVNSSGIL